METQLYMRTPGSPDARVGLGFARTLRDSCFFVALHQPFALQARNCLKSQNKTRCTVPYSSAPSVVPLRVLSAMPSCFAIASKMSQSIIDRTVAGASIAKTRGRSSQDRLAPVPPPCGHFIQKKDGHAKQSHDFLVPLREVQFRFVVCAQIEEAV